MAHVLWSVWIHFQAICHLSQFLEPPLFQAQSLKTFLNVHCICRLNRSIKYIEMGHFHENGQITVKKKYFFQLFIFYHISLLMHSVCLLQGGCEPAMLETNF